MAELVNPSTAGRGFGKTQRRDTWWVEIIPVVVLLGGFGAYATWRAIEGRFYDWGPYLSPFYSPLIDPNHHWWPFSPALLILAGPLGFRTTCYYYRKAYYRAFFADPPACAVGEGRKTYRGETAFPFILQNAHRYCWSRRWNARFARERDPADSLHHVLSLAAASVRRQA